MKQGRTNKADQYCVGSEHTGSSIAVVRTDGWATGASTHDPRTVHAVVFDDGRQRVALVSVDGCLFPSELVHTM